MPFGNFGPGKVHDRATGQEIAARKNIIICVRAGILRRFDAAILRLMQIVDFNKSAPAKDHFEVRQVIEDRGLNDPPVAEDDKSLGRIFHEAELRFLRSKGYTDNSPVIREWRQLLHSQRLGKDAAAQAVVDAWQVRDRK